MDWAVGVETWANAEYGQAERIEYATQPPSLISNELESAKNRLSQACKQVHRTVNHQLQIIGYIWFLNHEL